jgi:hypothetical protein
MAFAAGMIVFLGFAPSYYLRSITHATHYPTGIPISTTLRPLIHAHALVFSAWMLLFIAQNTLVATGRTNVHRRLGIMGAVLLPVMTVLGILTAVRGAKDGWNPGVHIRIRTRSWWSVSGISSSSSASPPPGCTIDSAPQYTRGSCFWQRWEGSCGRLSPGCRMSPDGRF